MNAKKNSVDYGMEIKSLLEKAQQETSYQQKRASHTGGEIHTTGFDHGEADTTSKTCKESQQQLVVKNRVNGLNNVEDTCSDRPSTLEQAKCRYIKRNNEFRRPRQRFGDSSMMQREDGTGNGGGNGVDKGTDIEPRGSKDAGSTRQSGLQRFRSNGNNSFV